jgi:hypothetical protein
MSDGRAAKYQLSARLRPLRAERGENDKAPESPGLCSFDPGQVS